MIEKANEDSSFFLISSPDLAGRGGDLGRFIQGSVISLQITEEMGSPTCGILSLHDPDLFFGHNFRNGMRLNITWGFKKWNKTLAEQEIDLNRKDELTGFPVRRGLQCIIQNPSGNGDQNGNLIYNLTFYSPEIFTGRENRIHTSGTKEDLIRQLLLEMKCTTLYINFDRRDESAAGQIQEETNFRFLVRLAAEMRCFFNVGYDQKGQRVGMFVDSDKISNDFLRSVTGSKGGYRTFEYKTGVANVMEYSWSQNVGESISGGDSVKLRVVNGVVYADRFIAKTETVQTWIFHPDRVAKALRKADDDGILAETAIQMLKTTDFMKLTEGGDENAFFTVAPEETAPQGFGYSISLKMLGDPIITAPAIVRFGDGFPSRLRQTDKSANAGLVQKTLTQFIMKKVTHNIGKTGYVCDAEISDALSVQGGFVH